MGTVREMRHDWILEKFYDFLENFRSLIRFVDNFYLSTSLTNHPHMQFNIIFMSLSLHLFMNEKHISKHATRKKTLWKLHFYDFGNVFIPEFLFHLSRHEIYDC